MNSDMKTVVVIFAPKRNLQDFSWRKYILFTGKLKLYFLSYISLHSTILGTVMIFYEDLLVASIIICVGIDSSIWFLNHA